MRLNEIRESLINDLTFKDELFRLFAELHSEMKKNKSTEEYDFVLKDPKCFGHTGQDEVVLFKNFKFDLELRIPANINISVVMIEKPKDKHLISGDDIV